MKAMKAVKGHEELRGGAGAAQDLCHTFLMCK